jgi:hypothetical protein
MDQEIRLFQEGLLVRRNIILLIIRTARHLVEDLRKSRDNL